jgi:MFS family permease
LIQVNNLGLSNLQIGQLAIFWILGWFSTAPIWGWIVDRYQPLFAILISIIIFIVPPLIYFWQSPYYLLLLASFLNGAASSSLEIGWINLMLRLGGEHSSQYSGLYLTLLGIRGLIGPLIGNSLLEIMVINQVFLVTVGLLFLGLIPLIVFYYVQKNKLLQDF